jgi:hypothetical protein
MFLCEHLLPAMSRDADVADALASQNLDGARALSAFNAIARSAVGKHILAIGSLEDQRPVALAEGAGDE